MTKLNLKRGCKIIQKIFKIENPYLFFNYKTIKVCCSYYNIEHIKFFIEEYLKKRHDYVVECIKTIHNNEI